MPDIGNTLIVGICDDEEAAQLLIEERLRDIMSIVFADTELLIYTFGDGEEFCRAFPQKQFDLVFLDIEMPGWSGFKLAERLRLFHPELHLVFVSSHENCVFDSHEFAPLWFVRKSTLERDLLRAVKKYMSITADKRIRYRIKDGFGIRDILICNIIYFECIGHDIIVRTPQEIYHTYGSLKQIEEEVKKYGFLRIHRSYLLNLRYISSIENLAVNLLDGSSVAMGKDRKREVREEYQKYARWKW